MKVFLKQIKASQFKGKQELNVNLSDSTSIFGRNRSGKSTVINTVLWCLFGKDIFGRKDYKIMPLDSDGGMIPHQEPIVELIYDIDGAEVKFKRKFSQKWVKKRGEAESSFDGSCETSYFVDDVPMKQKDYQSKISQYIDETMFRILTIPSFFPSMEWKDRRSIIEGIVGEVNYDAIGARDEFKKLMDAMKGKSIEDYRKVLAIQKKALKAEIARIPALIEAAEEFIPESEPDYSGVAKSISLYKEQIKSIDKSIADKTKIVDDYKDLVKNATSEIDKKEEEKREFISLFIADKQKQLDSLSQELIVLTQEKGKISSGLTELESSLDSVFLDVKAKHSRLQQLTVQRQANKSKYTEVNESEFVTPENGTCPSCNQVVTKTEAEIEELKAKFNISKAERLESIVKANEPLRIECDEISNTTLPQLENRKSILATSISEATNNFKAKVEKISILDKRIASINISALKEEAMNNPAYKMLCEQADEIKVKDTAPNIDTAEQEKEKAELTLKIEALQKELNSKENIDKAKANIKEYQKKGKNFAIELASLEGLEYSCELFERAAAEDVEEKINSRLGNDVSIKLFHLQNNGGIQPICDILIDGVPYNAANTEATVNAGLEIMNVLCDHYNTYLPRFIDCRESVTDIVESKCQTISLIVDPKAEVLTIKNN